MLCALCALGFKRDGKVQKLERYITQLLFPVWVLTSRHIEYEYFIRTFRYRQGVPFEIFSSYITGSDIHFRILATMVLITFLLKCCVITQPEGLIECKMFIRLRELPEYGPYSYICKSTY